VLKHDTLWSWQLIFLSFFSFLLFFMYTLFSFFFFYVQYNVVLITQLKFHQFTWQLIYIYLFSPTWTETYPIWMFPYYMAKGQVNNEGLGFNQLKHQSLIVRQKWAGFQKFRGKFIKRCAYELTAHNWRLWFIWLKRVSNYSLFSQGRLFLVK